VFVIFADGAEIELILSRESQPDPHPHGGAPVVLLDKRGIFADGVARHEPPAQEPRPETIRRQITWFWHDVSHFVVALGRGQRWFAYGQIDELRRYCLNLARLHQDPSAEAEGYWKVDASAAEKHLGALEATVSRLERDDLLRAAEATVVVYRELAHALAERHSIPYPADLDRIMSDRLATLRT